MALINITSPHAHNRNATGHIMLWVCGATLPGLAALTYWFGLGSIINIAIIVACSIVFEALVIKIRHRPIGFYLKDNSALLTALLLGLSIPPLAPWWIGVIGAFTAIILAKQLYGGLGSNPFNPAMVAYVVLLISFPVEMTQWVAPHTLSGEYPGFNESLASIFLSAPVDAYTSATPLDQLKHNGGELISELMDQAPIFSQAMLAGVGWEWVNIAFLFGGLVLLYKKIFTWHGPVGMLLGLGAMALLFSDGGSSIGGGSVTVHLLSGATMFGAFFIITDPVSGATSNRGRFIFGLGVGITVYIIRVWGNYPDAVAFAVLLMNFAAPFIDYYTPPRTYGHKTSAPIVGKEKS